jgi:hypothetical protein
MIRSTSCAGHSSAMASASNTAQSSAGASAAASSPSAAAFQPVRVELDSYAAHISVGDWQTAWPPLIKKLAKSASKSEQTLCTALRINKALCSDCSMLSALSSNCRCADMCSSPTATSTCCTARHSSASSKRSENYDTSFAPRTACPSAMEGDVDEQRSRAPHCSGSRAHRLVGLLLHFASSRSASMCCTSCCLLASRRNVARPKP